VLLVTTVEGQEIQAQHLVAEAVAVVVLVW
jgi:hypothetical protein